VRIEKLRQGVIAASDLEAQVEYYTKVLGLPLQIRDGDRWVQLQAGAVSFALAPSGSSRRRRSRSSQPQSETFDTRAGSNPLGAAGCLPPGETPFRASPRGAAGARILTCG
jgi:catechol 2,3-dioxygenase-like lactoylglutathione lyase family enzyme